MKKLIKQPTLDQFISLEEKGIAKGKVVQIIRFEESLGGLTGEYLKREIKTLQEELGEDYKELFFEAVEQQG